MGTLSEWMWVAFSAVFWGGWMLLWGTRWTEIEPGRSFFYVFGLALCSLEFGVGVTFHWQAFHWPLLFLTVASFVTGAVLARLARRKVSSADNLKRS